MSIGMRERAFGQDYQPTVVDRFGVWLSGHQIRKFSGSLKGKKLGDFGCGYNATFVRSVLKDLERAVVIDSAIAPDLKQQPNVTAIEGMLPDALKQLPTRSLDVVLCVSLLEHLWDPQTALQECYRITRPGGVCMFNVP